MPEEITKVLVTGGSGFIGTHLISKLLTVTSEIINYDISPPNLREHNEFWFRGDLLDRSCLENLIAEKKPNVVVHLAARTDTEGEALEDYAVNTVGTRVLLECVEKAKCVRHVLLASTQFVNQSPTTPENDVDFAPHTVYGESKVLTELLLRDGVFSGYWTIFRPTNIWGPWHPRYAVEFWSVLAKGLYVHPRGPTVIRSYGYVENVVEQIVGLVLLGGERCHEKVVYVGDEPILLQDWVNAFSLALRGRRVMLVPRVVLSIMGKIGDALKFASLRFPITTSRYNSMTTSNAISMAETFELVGSPTHSLEEGVSRTVEWLEEYHPHLTARKKSSGAFDDI